MINDTKTSHKLKVKILNHVSGLQGKITKPRLKFVCEMTYGITSVRLPDCPELELELKLIAVKGFGKEPQEYLPT